MLLPELNSMCMVYGVYMSDSPLGPVYYMPNNPVFYKPGGFMNGAGHGSTVIGPTITYWHFASMELSVNVNWERGGSVCSLLILIRMASCIAIHLSEITRILLRPFAGKMGEFAGWMLLSYNKPVKASSFPG